MLLFCIVVVGILPGLARAGYRDPATVLSLRRQYTQLLQERKALEFSQNQLLKEQAELADEIERLKASDPGIFVRMRLERLLARNLEVSQQLESIARNLAQNETARQEKRQQLYNAYTAEMEKVVKLMRHTSNKKAAADLARQFYELQRRREMWRSPTIAKTDYSMFVVEIDSLDGPDEIIAKAEILEDLVNKIRAAIKRIDGRIKRLQRELRLNTEMQDMVHEMNLFQEGTRFQVPGSQPEAAPEEPDVREEIEVHRSPLGEESGDLPGTDRVALSIKREISKLEQERSYLVQLAAKLSAKAVEFRKKASQIRR